MRIAIESILFAVILTLLLAVTCKAHGETTDQPALTLGTNQLPAMPPWPVRAAHYLGVPDGASLDVAGGVSYAQAFSTGNKVGWWVAAIYEQKPDSLLNYEVGIQQLKPSKREGYLWQPNGLLLVKKTFHIGPVSVTPLLEAGAAFDDNFDPYGIYGAGVAIGYRHFALIAGIERWTGPRDAFTVVKVGPEYSFTF